VTTLKPPEARFRKQAVRPNGARRVRTLAAVPTGPLDAELPGTSAAAPGSPGWAELRFRAMGTHVHLAVLGDDPSLVIDARRRIDDLEQRWSRFLPESLLTRLNQAGGHPVSVDQETFDLVQTAVAAWHDTGHRFDPTVHDAVVAAGYDRTFDEIATRAGPAPVEAPRPTPGCAGIELDPDQLWITLPVGTHLDLGGIGKGRAADLVAVDLVRAGAWTALVNLGGDLRIGGELPAGGPFAVAIEDPADLERTATTVELGPGALATSSRARRRWSVDGHERHHLIDPATGSPATTGVAAVTVIDDEATRAEVLAKAALVAGVVEGPALLERAEVPALVIDDGGDHHRLGGFEAYER
jgi:thiamine biosynthesis lipoprotein